MVADVAHLVAGHALELLVVHELQKPGGVGDRRPARTDTSGERVRRRVLDDVHGGRRNALTDRQSVDQFAERTIPISGSQALLPEVLRISLAPARSENRTPTLATTAPMTTPAAAAVRTAWSDHMLSPAGGGRRLAPRKAPTKAPAISHNSTKAAMNKRLRRLFRAMASYT